MRKTFRGAVYVETALVFPIFLMMLLFLVDAGYYLFKVTMLSNGVFAMSREIGIAAGVRRQFENDDVEACTRTLDQVTATVCSALGSTTQFVGPVAVTVSIVPKVAELPYDIISVSTLTDGSSPFCIFCKYFPLVNGNSQIQIVRVFGVESKLACTDASETVNC